MKKILLGLLITGVIQNNYAMQSVGGACKASGGSQAADMVASYADKSQESMQYAALLNAIVQNDIAIVQKMLAEGVSIFVVGPKNTTLYQDVLGMPDINPTILSILDQAALEVIPVELAHGDLAPFYVKSSYAQAMGSRNGNKIPHPLLQDEQAEVYSLTDSIDRWRIKKLNGKNIDILKILEEPDEISCENFLTIDKIKLLLSSISGRRVFARATLMACNQLPFGANVNEPVAGSLSRLHQAVLRGDTILAHRLINAGADVNASDNEGLTPLHIAARNGYTEIAKLLIAAGANVNAVKDNDWTALMMSVITCQTEFVRLLINACADVNARNNWGITALEFAKGNDDCTAVVNLLREHGAL